MSQCNGLDIHPLRKETHTHHYHHHHHQSSTNGCTSTQQPVNRYCRGSTATQLTIAYTNVRPNNSWSLWGMSSIRRCQRSTTCDHSDRFVCSGGVSNLCSRFVDVHQCCGRGGVQWILIVMYSYNNEQAIRTCEEPIKGGARACVVGGRADALGCIWLKNDFVLVDKNCNIARISDKSYANGQVCLYSMDSSGSNVLQTHVWLKCLSVIAIKCLW